MGTTVWFLLVPLCVVSCIFVVVICHLFCFASRVSQALSAISACLEAAFPEHIGTLLAPGDEVRNVPGDPSEGLVMLTYDLRAFIIDTSVVMQKSSGHRVSSFIALSILQVLICVTQISQAGGSNGVCLMGWWKVQGFFVFGCHIHSLQQNLGVLLMHLQKPNGTYVIDQLHPLKRKEPPAEIKLVDIAQISNCGTAVVKQFAKQVRALQDRIYGGEAPAYSPSTSSSSSPSSVHSPSAAVVPRAGTGRGRSPPPAQTTSFFDSVKMMLGMKDAAPWFKWLVITHDASTSTMRVSSREDGGEAHRDAIESAVRQIKQELMNEQRDESLPNGTGTVMFASGMSVKIIEPIRNTHRVVLHRVPVEGKDDVPHWAQDVLGIDIFNNTVIKTFWAEVDIAGSSISASGDIVRCPTSTVTLVFADEQHKKAALSLARAKDFELRHQDLPGLSFLQDFEEDAEQQTAKSTRSIKWTVTYNPHCPWARPDIERCLREHDFLFERTTDESDEKRFDQQQSAGMTSS
jgi:hypothetical protein